MCAHFLFAKDTFESHTWMPVVFGPPDVTALKTYGCFFIGSAEGRLSIYFILAVDHFHSVCSGLLMHVLCVSLLAVESLVHESCCSQLLFKCSHFRMMSDTWWPSLKMDVGPLTPTLLIFFLSNSLLSELFRHMTLWEAVFAIRWQYAWPHYLSTLWGGGLRMCFSPT